MLEIQCQTKPDVMPVFIVSEKQSNVRRTKCKVTTVGWSPGRRERSMVLWQTGGRADLPSGLGSPAEDHLLQNTWALRSGFQSPPHLADEDLGWGLKPACSQAPQVLLKMLRSGDWTPVQSEKGSPGRVVCSKGCVTGLSLKGSQHGSGAVLRGACLSEWPQNLLCTPMDPGTCGQGVRTGGKLRTPELGCSPGLLLRVCFKVITWGLK